MSNFAFPSLESLSATLPKPGGPALAGWVEELSSMPAEAAPSVRGWAPPTLELVKPAPETKAPDFEAEKQEAQEEGFRQGYADGLMAGTERGTAEGRREGLEQALAEERARIEEFSQALGEVASTVDPAVQRWMASIEARATEMAMNAVRALLAAELQIDQPSAMGIVREALGLAEGATRATIRLSLADRAALAERQDEILAACAGLRNVELVDDASITGGCVIETENGVVDATLATRLTLLEAA